MTACGIKPKTRSGFRLMIGKRYFTVKRWIFWICGGISFAKPRKDAACDYVWFCHATPFMRKLQRLDERLQINKIENLRIACAKIDGVVIKPGETLSFWRLVGKPTYAKGYKDGLILNCGKLTSGVGGGLCQLTNLLYWCALHTPLTVTERYRHSYDVFPDCNRTQPFGSGATCLYNYRDLMIRNDTPDTFQIRVTLSDTHLCGCVKSSTEPFERYEVYERNHVIKHEVFGAYSRNNEIWRRTYDNDGRQVKNERVAENHALMMYPPLLTHSR